MKRTPIKDPVEVSPDIPDNMPECFGELFDPRNTHCIQCAAFNMCAYMQLKEYDTNYLDMSRILEISDEEIVDFIGHQKPVSEVYEWLHTEGHTIDPIAVQNRLDRFVRDYPHASINDDKITVL